MGTGGRLEDFKGKNKRPRNPVVSEQKIIVNGVEDKKKKKITIFPLKGL